MEYIGPVLIMERKKYQEVTLFVWLVSALFPYISLDEKYHEKCTEIERFKWWKKYNMFLPYLQNIFNWLLLIWLLEEPLYKSMSHSEFIRGPEKILFVCSVYYLNRDNWWAITSADSWVFTKMSFNNNWDLGNCLVCINAFNPHLE